jgi:valyl-tRNA synthetase
MMNGATVDGPMPELSTLNAIDKWILSRLTETIRDADSLFEKFEFAKASELIYHFAWDDLCDWYLELSKESFATGNAANSQRVLGHVLDLVIAKWPEADLSYLDESAENLVTQMQAVITEVRRFRNDQGVKATAKIPGRLTTKGELANYASAMGFVLKLEAKEFTPTASFEIGSVKCELDLSGTVDVVAERARLTKDLATVQKDQQTAQVKLGNEGFMAKAPQEVVTEIKERLVKTQAEIERITAALAALPSA